MYKSIMLPYDGSPLSEKAVSEGISFAKINGSTITLLYVLTPHHLLLGGGHPVPGLKQLEQQFQDELKKKADDMLASAKKRAAEASVACNTLIEEGPSPHEVIIASAARLKCDLIIMASHGRRGIEGILIGSETVKVLTHTKIPVLVLH